jgi:CRISPR-associated protein Csm2
MNINDFKKDWIVKGLDEAAVYFAEKFGEHLCDLQNDKRVGRMAMTTSQIRNVFGEVKRIQAKGFSNAKSDFLLLKPKLAYAEARVIAKSGKSRLSDFRKVMDMAHTEVKGEEQQFQNFVDFLEAILAYHKFYGGRD